MFTGIVEECGSVKAIRQASLARLEEVLPKNAAQAVYHYFNTTEEE